MKRIVWLAAGVLAGSVFGGRVELNDGWEFTRDEPITAQRELAVPNLLRILDGQGLELMETPAATLVREGVKIGADVPYLKPGYKHAGWEKVRVPHDAGIVHPFSPDLDPFDGYLPGTGAAWYRYAFEFADGVLKLPDGQRLDVPTGGTVYFDCDGAMAFPVAWLNGTFVGGWPNGYMPWRTDLTKFLKPGANVLFIRTYRPAELARWHTGLGLTRRCWLQAEPADHIVPDSVTITTPEVTRARATVKVTYRMTRSGAREKTFTVEKPRLWDVDDPFLYELELEGATFRYGIRTFAWTADDGFHLNGRRVQLKGFCFHQDLCALGSVANRTAIRRRLELAKELGMNALRMSHYPHATDWYELCDEMGILVMDELTDAWSQAKRANDYNMLFERWHERDLRTLIRRHRNHPSIVIWSLGNEIWESRHGAAHWPLFQKNGTEMHRLAKQEDPTRPTVTANDNGEVWRSPLAQFTDVWGFNYRPEEYANYRKLWPGRPVVGTETMCVQTSRGEYQFNFAPEKDGRFGLPNVNPQYVDFHSTAYGLHAIRPADFEWTAQDANPFVAGSFSWTAFDYLGAPMVTATRARKPNYSDPARQARALEEQKRYGYVRAGIHSCGTGVFDLAGLAKDEAFLYRARWRPDAVTVHVLPHWTWPGREGKVTPVYVYSSGDEVELFVNGRSQGRTAKEKGLWRFRFNGVVYEPGELKAVAYKNGKVWGEETVRTAGAPARLVAEPARAEIRADGEDVGYVTLRVVDTDGNFCPTAKVRVTAAVAGAGEYVAMENGDETDFTWLREPWRDTYNGMLSALVRAKKGATGEIAVTFTAEGLPPVTARVRAAAPAGAAAAEKKAEESPRAAALRAHVAAFNADDNEIYVEAVPNAAAADWLAANVPLMDCPDELLQKVYDFRWWTFRKHLRRAAKGWVVTEFSPNVPWGGPDNIISCAAGWHAREGRWLRDADITRAYLRILLESGRARAYTFAAARAALDVSETRDRPGDTAWLAAMYPLLTANMAGWEKKHRPDPEELFKQTDNAEGQECSIAGAQCDAATMEQFRRLAFVRNAWGLRPGFNAHMYADYDALARIAARLGKAEESARWAAKAAALKRLINTRLWNAEKGFYLTRYAGADAHWTDVRELSGYTPWLFGVAGEEMKGAWRQLTDEAGFKAPFGPTTAERRHPLFRVTRTGHECQWAGASWPYLTCSTLVALANHLRESSAPALTAADWHETLNTYARTHFITWGSGARSLWIDESADPFTGEWISRAQMQNWGPKGWHCKTKEPVIERGKDYNHSEFCDLLITGVAGINPLEGNRIELTPLIPAGWAWFRLENVPVKGGFLTYTYDKTGARYGDAPPGFTVTFNGRQVFHAAAPARATVEL